MKRGAIVVRVFLALAALVIGAIAAIPAAAVPPQPLACGSVLTQSTKLANDIGPCPGDGLIIGASNITLDLNGHSVTGTFDPLTPGRPPMDEGITLRQVQGSTVKNGEVTHFSTGVMIDGGSANRVTQMNVHDNRGRPSAGDGITVFGSDRNRVHNNRVVHNGPASGITLLADESVGSAGSSYNEISDNVVLDNNIPEIDTDGTPNWRRDIGIAIEGPGATHNQILRNRIDNSGTHGIQIFPACSNGYNVSGGCPDTVPNDYNVIRDNQSNRNGTSEPKDGFPVGDGISILAMGPSVVKLSAHNTIEGNTTDANQRNGISLGGGNGQELATGAWTTGAENYACFRAQGGDPDNPIVDSPDLCGINDTTVVHNTASGNGISGIYIGPRSDGNTVSHNRADANAIDGIAIGLAVRTDENQNPVIDANGQFVLIPGSAGRNNTLEHNRASENSRWDGSDGTPGCQTNAWLHNLFTKVNQPCVL
jgi:parallel beta-helix repeat protein